MPTVGGNFVVEAPMETQPESLKCLVPNCKSSRPIVGRYPIVNNLKVSISHISRSRAVSAPSTLCSLDGPTTCHNGDDESQHTAYVPSCGIEPLTLNDVRAIGRLDMVESDVGAVVSDATTLSLSCSLSDGLEVAYPRLAILQQLRQDVLGFPKILLVARRHVRKNKFIDFVGEYHINMIQHFGGAPIIVPRTQYTIESLDEYFPIDGFMIVEGEDLGVGYNPYGPQDETSILNSDLEAHVKASFPSDCGSDNSKDIIEWKLLQRVVDENIPYLGICRGAQILNVVSGGTLYFDVLTELPGAIQHIDPSNYDSYRHDVYITPNTPLAEWYSSHVKSSDDIRANRISVNSYHHQGIKRLSNRYVPMCFAPDGLIEGFYDPECCDPSEGKFCVGLQFHPERMLCDYTENAKVYEMFMISAWNYRRFRQASSADDS